jgi:hypothetical protein
LAEAVVEEHTMKDMEARAVWEEAQEEWSLADMVEV